MAAWEGMAAPIPIQVTDKERRELQRIVDAKTSRQRDVFRARIILGLAQGLTHGEIAKEQSTSLLAIGRWRKRWALEGIDGLRDAPGRGRKSTLPTKAVAKVLSLARTQAPEGGPWSVRAMAVGLYLNPPDRALVLCCDEKSQCQALERTQPGLPLGQGHIRTKTHDYYRHGTVTLFAALDYLSGKVFSHILPRHRHQEWLAFLRKINKETDPTLDLHIICDNYSTHKHAKVRS